MFEERGNVESGDRFRREFPIIFRFNPIRRYLIIKGRRISLPRWKQSVENIMLEENQYVDKEELVKRDGEMILKSLIVIWTR